MKRETNLFRQPILVSGNDVNNQLIEEALALDDLVYGKNLLLKKETCFDYFAHNPSIYHMLLIDERVVGYINFSPISDKVFEEISSGHFNDMIITGDDVLPFNKDKNARYHGYFSSIVINPNYRGHGYAACLVNAAIHTLIDLRKQGIIFDCIVSDALTEGGAYFSSHYFGLSKHLISKHSSTIYLGYLQDEGLHLTAHNQELLKAYQIKEK